jgi:lipopolysaccharide/colanic/teichoic acid biosynthesis glycosyltransferase
VYGLLKRAVEGGLAAVLLVLSLPLLPALALCVRASGQGPILHRNVRVGQNGRLIRLTKFRTMTLSDDTDQLWATDQSSRITPIGRWLRRYRFDEIPQLWHVLRGDISLVGPRPEQPQIVNHLQDRIEFYAARHCVRPGLTGWAQVNHGYAGSVEDTIEKLQYEFFYINRQSLALDLVILLATVRTILSGGGQ